MIDEKALGQMQLHLFEQKKLLTKHSIEGPWMDETDREEFVYEGYQCLMLRSPTSYSWCGYVGVEEGHPWHGKKYDSLDVDAHGGLTYSDKCSGHICHTPEDGQPDSLWWVGFDCGHCWDISPGMDLITAMHSSRTLFRMPDQVYRDTAYVKREVCKMVNQARIA